MGGSASGHGRPPRRRLEATNLPMRSPPERAAGRPVSSPGPWSLGLDSRNATSAAWIDSECASPAAQAHRLGRRATHSRTHPVGDGGIPSGGSDRGRRGPAPTNQASRKPAGACRDQSECASRMTRPAIQLQVSYGTVLRPVGPVRPMGPHVSGVRAGSGRRTGAGQQSDRSRLGLAGRPYGALREPAFSNGLTAESWTQRSFESRS